jgi:hypothetical protein
MKTRRILLWASLAALLWAATASAQNDGWQAKPYQQWTKSEAMKVLEESPWAQVVAQSGPVVNFGGGDTNTNDAVYALRLRSSLPVRQALLRLRQLSEKYDQMSDKKKAEFDEKNRALVECPACADNYVIAMIPPYAADARALKLERTKLYVRLMDDRGRTRELVHLIAPKTAGQEVILFFPRFDEKGEPLITPASKKLVFTIDATVLGLGQSLRRFEFDVSKLVRDGRVDF